MLKTIIKWALIGFAIGYLLSVMFGEKYPGKTFYEDTQIRAYV